MKQVLEGSHAVSEAVRLARVAVVSAYPITPQTHIVEALSNYSCDGTMAAKFLCVESEHSAMAAVIGAASCGVRAFTATSSQGLAYMHELLHWASGARLPIVMAVVNRALAPGWNIWADQTDSLAQRDTGWLQLYCEDGQEVHDTTLQAFRLAERVNLPVMVILDAFFLSHTYEPVEVADQGAVDRFLPALVPRFKLDVNEPYALGQMASPAVYMEMRHSIQMGMQSALAWFAQTEQDFSEVFQRAYGAIETVACEGADIVLVVSGTAASTCRLVVNELRAAGERVGMLKIKMLRPFPTGAVRQALAGVAKVAVVDRNFSFGASGIFAQEVKAALYNMDHPPKVYSYIAGLGGRDITTALLKKICAATHETPAPGEESIWMDLRTDLTTPPDNPTGDPK
jgi:pyruvate/2-oxoacid:ferredoxin oxidoreductase alpha subunit